MDVEEFDERMRSIVEHVVSGEWESVFSRATELKATLLAEDECDPLQLGWARFYQLKGLYESGQYDEAYELLKTPEPETLVMTQKNAAWICSIGAELAVRKDRPEEVVEWGRVAISHREEVGDSAELAATCNTICTLLTEVGHPELNTEFSTRLARLGVQNRWGGAVLDGIRHMIHNAEVSESRNVISRIALYRSELEQMAQSGVNRADGLLERIEGGDWYRRYMATLEKEEALWKACTAGDFAEVAGLVPGDLSADAIYPLRPGLPTPLMAASFEGHPRVVEYLLESGADVDEANVQGRTALMHAADQGHDDVVSLLLGHGADPDHRDMLGQTALHVSAWQGHEEVVDVLLGADPRLEARDGTGNTPLALAATEDVPDVVLLLLEAGADPNARTDGDQTPIMGAAMFGHYEVAHALLEAGADTDFEDDKGMSARDWAEQEGHEEIVDLFDQQTI